jgi:hypothetical protein
MNASEREIVRNFLAGLRDEKDPHATQALMSRLGPRHWHDEPAEVLARWQAFEDGLAASAGA